MGSAVLILFPAEIFFIYALACCNDVKRFIWLDREREGARNEGMIPNTSKNGTSTFGPMMSLLALVEILSL